jgi:hypothetical protein
VLSTAGELLRRLPEASGVRGQPLSSRARALLTAVLYATLVIVCGLIAYRMMFSGFRTYDDEGFFLYSLKLFGSGHPLYTSDFSEYGPFYYELFGALSALAGHVITTDIGRLIQIGLWVFESFAIGIAAHKLTGRLALGVAAMAVAFALGSALTNEPMHPVALVTGLLAVMALVIAFALDRYERSSLFALGALAAALLLTKINIGGFVIISIAFASIMASPWLARPPVLRWLAVAGLVLVGPVIMASTLDTYTTRSFAILTVLSTASLAMVAMPYPEARARLGPPHRGRKWPIWLIGGFAACLIPCVVVVLALGTNIGDMIDQVIVVPTRTGSFLSVPVTLGNNALWWPLAATAVAWVVRQSWRGRIGEPGATATLLSGVLRTLAGVAILLSLTNSYPFAISPDATFALALPLAWVAALPSRRDRGPQAALIRLLIPALAVLQCVQAYPVAGTQVSVGSLLLVLCGAVCVADGWSELTAWSSGNLSRSPLVSSALGALTAVVAAGLVYSQIIQNVEVSHDTYDGNVALTIRGASRLRLLPSVSSQYEQLVKAIHAAGCKALVTYPGMYSLNMWTGLPTPSPLTGQQVYWLSLSDSQQEAVLRADMRTPHLCEVSNAADLAFYGGPPKRPTPLIRYLELKFTSVSTIGAYVLETRHSP